jgi:uncharacterized protein YbjQ (UPF0145 family)
VRIFVRAFFIYCASKLIKMLNSKDILIVTTSTIEGQKIIRHIKPVTAHIVAGTNVFSDIFADLSDVFGGRSTSYQKQLTSLYNEAIYKLKLAAYELGANCIVGLSIDMDEVSGKNKSMFMLTAIGTAVVTEEIINEPRNINIEERYENVSYERLNVLHKKKELLKKAEQGVFNLNDNQWKFVTDNQIHEIFPFLLKSYQAVVTGQLLQVTVKEFYDKVLIYIDAFPEESKISMLYECLNIEKSEHILSMLSKIVYDLQLLDLNYVNELLQNDDFQKQKKGLQLVTYNKAFYNKEDVKILGSISDYIQCNFKERGKRTTKKQMLSSKEKEVWICECGKTNDIGSNNDHCDTCTKDIYGFKNNDITPVKAIENINLKIELISELVK